MVNDLYREMGTYFFGDDCSGNAAWLQAALRQDRPQQAVRAEAHWGGLDEAKREALYMVLSGAINERSPVPSCIHNDYVDLFARAQHYIDQ